MGGDAGAIGGWLGAGIGASRSKAPTPDRPDCSAKSRSLTPSRARQSAAGNRKRGTPLGMTRNIVVRRTAKVDRADGLLVEFILSTWVLFRGGGGPRIGIEGCFYGR